jgi:hypothetical protein
MVEEVEEQLKETKELAKVRYGFEGGKTGKLTTARFAGREAEEAEEGDRVRSFARGTSQSSGRALCRQSRKV